MSFSYDTKKELCSLRHSSKLSLKAECYAMLLFGKHFNKNNISFQTENPCIASHYADLLAATAGVYVDIKKPLSRNNAHKPAITVSIPDMAQREHVINFFGHDKDYIFDNIALKDIDENDNNINYDISKIINIKNISSQTEPDFIRGAFLSCGTISDPAKEYHLEMCIGNALLCHVIIEMLKKCSLPAKLIIRKGQYVIYYKESEQIEDFLTLIGAVNASMSIMNIKILKDIRNRANRITNCETANIEKTVAASSEQVKAIKYIKNHLGLNSLPPQLREIAQLRLDNPEMSLRELGESLPEPLSRSGVNHRLKRIYEYYQSAIDKNKKA